MLSPKRTKFRKMQKGNNRGVAWRGSNVEFGDFGLQCMEPGRLTSRQIEAARIAESIEDNAQQLVHFAREFLADRFCSFFSCGVWGTSSTGRN